MGVVACVSVWQVYVVLAEHGRGETQHDTGNSGLPRLRTRAQQRGSEAAAAVSRVTAGRGWPKPWRVRPQPVGAMTSARAQTTETEAMHEF